MKSMKTLTRLAAILSSILAFCVISNARPGNADETPKNAEAAKADAPKDAKKPDAKAKSADLRPSLEKWKLETRLQGGRNTCTLFAVTAAIEFAVAKKQHHCDRLSVEFLNWASNEAEKSPEDGANFELAWNGFEAYGICPDEEYPYKKEFDPASKPSEKSIADAKELLSNGLKLHWIKEWDADKGVNDKQLAEIKRTLRRHWPVCGGFLWPKKNDWEGKTLGVIPRSEVMDGHSVLLVGYQDDEKQPGGGIFLFRNTAGSNRDCTMTYEYALIYMNDAVWIGYDKEKAKDKKDGKTPKKK
jgi:C1A family cysteine protease